MVHKIRSAQFVLAVAVTVLLFGSSLAFPVSARQKTSSNDRPPAGQRCPDGYYVIGFDAGSNIICSGECGNSVLDTGEACDDGNTVSGDGCSAACQRDVTIVVEEHADETPVSEKDAAASLPELVISDIEPSSVVFGASGVTVTVTGTGFDETSIILFDGESYRPTVNATGTRLTFQPETSRLSIGSYAVTVANDSGLKVTRKRGLVIF